MSPTQKKTMKQDVSTWLYRGIIAVLLSLNLHVVGKIETIIEKKFDDTDNEIKMLHAKDVSLSKRTTINSNNIITLYKNQTKLYGKVDELKTVVDDTY